MEYKNIKVTTDGLVLQIHIRKHHERALQIFLVFAFAVIALFIYLLRVVETNADGSNPIFFVIMRLIFYGVGGIMFLAMVYEAIKLEVVEINRYNLILRDSFLNHPINERQYELKRIRDIKLAPTPSNKWKTTDKYADSSQSWQSISKDTRKVYPTIQFEHNGEIIMLANGLTPNEAQVVIGLILKKIQQLN